MKQAGLSHSELLKADKNYPRAAADAALRYISDNTAGICRKGKTGAFNYFYRGKKIKSPAVLNRIRRLAIPPSWTEVWISPFENGHIQATGIDLRGRKQYRYHTGWNALRSETKFHRLYEFGKALPGLRKKVQKDLAAKELTENKVLAAAIRLMEQTYIRIGSNGYEKLYGSYGLTTLKDKHVTIKKDKVLFSFTGKKGVMHEVAVQNKKLAHIIKQCRDIPGKELFQYYDENGQRKTIDSGMINAYIRRAAGDDFSAKDFRTWAGSLKAIECFEKLEKPAGAADIKKNILLMLDEVSAKLGNTRNICKKYYVHPALLSLYEANRLHEYLHKNPNGKIKGTGLSGQEKILMQILRQCI